MNTKVFELPFPSSLTRPTEIDIETIFWRMTSSLVFDRSLCRYDNFRSLLILSPIFLKNETFYDYEKEKMRRGLQSVGLQVDNYDTKTTRRQMFCMSVCMCVFLYTTCSSKGFLC